MVRQSYGYAAKYEMQKLQKKVDSFSNIDHVNKLQTIFLPKFEVFSSKIDDFYEGIDQIKVSMRMLDESMSRKASKAQMYMLEKRLLMEFVTMKKY